LYFKKLYPAARLINLTDNYRSSQSILDAAGSLIRQNATVDVLVPKSSFLKSQTSHPEEKIGIVKLSEEWMESQWVAQKIEEQLNSGVEGGEIAVIVRQNRDFEQICRVLAQKGIGFSVSSNQDVTKDKWIDQLLTLLRATSAFDTDPGANSDWLMIKILHFEVFEIDPMSIYKLLKERAKKRVGLIEVLDDVEALKKSSIVDLEKITYVNNLLKKWVGVANNEMVDKLFIDVLNDSGLMEKILGMTNSLEILAKIKNVFEDLKRQLTKNPEMGLVEYIRYLDLLREHQIGIDASGVVDNKNSVRLMTAHKAKGLEFDTVFLMQCVDGHWGNSRKRGGLFKLPWEELNVKLALGVELDEIEDERRLFYVGLTRARKCVYASYANLNSEGKEQLPCQFLSEIEEQYIKEIEIGDFEKYLKTHLETLFEKPQIAQNPVDKEYFQMLFREQGLSATSLGNYLECPWKYFYRNLLQLPDVKNKYMVFGSAIHLAISKYIISVKSNDRLSIEDTKAIALDYLRKETLTKRDFDDLTAKCSKALDVFYKERMSKWDDIRESELRVRGVKLSEDVVINGVIDMIEPKESEDGSAEVVVTDFKTGRVKTRGEISDDEGDYNYQRQLTFYKLLLDNYSYKKMKVVEGVIDFVEADTKGMLHREVFEITDQDAENLKEIVLGVADEIMNLKFWDRYCDVEDCEYCNLRRIIVSR
jgi:DNA helicase-2/ATP-dependent DNA helicase PcrA